VGNNFLGKGTNIKVAVHIQKDQVFPKTSM
jgi:hypothetical protein